jgi:opacity protein-like surface antigen
MNIRTFALGFVLVSAGALSAQEEQVTPKVEVGLNYSWFHVSSTNRDLERTGNGGSGSFEYNLNKNFGLVADIGGYANTRVNDRLLTYLFGPRYNWRHSRLNPYAQVLFGGAYVWSNLNTAANTKNAFAMAAGGGLDYGLTRHIAINPIQVEYVLTKFNSTDRFGGVQNDIRYSAGVVFRFGER